MVLRVPHFYGWRSAIVTGVRIGVIGLAALTGWAGCGGDRQVVRITATPAATARDIRPGAGPDIVVPPDAVGPFDFPPGVSPLTGLITAPEALARRPLAIKISNSPDEVRPQAGIGEADLVFEHYVEGGYTRFTAIYWSRSPALVGSVRSARLLDLELPAMYGALFAYSGANEPIRQRLAALPFAPRLYEGVSVGEPLFFRDPGIEMPHNLFVVPAAVWARANADGQNDPPAGLGGMAFGPTPPLGDPAAAVTIDYGPDTVRWTYDPAGGVYRRTVDGLPHLDATTGGQVSAANVVIVYAHHQDDLSIPVGEWNGEPYYSTEIQLWTLGPALILRDGVQVRGWWARWEENDMLSLWADEAGTHMIALKPGNTWFQVVPLEFSGVAVGS